MACRLDDTAGNMADACRLSRDAARQGARMVLFPEGCLTGNALSGPDRQAVLPVENSAFQALSRVAVSDGITICVGFITPFGSKFNAVHAIIEPDGNVRFQRKAFRVFAEPSFLEAWPDPERVVFQVDGARMVIVICSEFGVPAVQAAVDRVAPDLVLHPSAGCMKKEEVWQPDAEPSVLALAFDENCRRVVSRAALTAKQSGMPKMSANPVGFDGETWWPGNSYAVDAAGHVVLSIKGENQLSRMQSVVAVAEISLGR